MTRSPHSISHRRDDWTRALRHVAGQPLTLCPGFVEVAWRWEAWWRFEADRPILQAALPAEDCPPGGKCLDLLRDPDRGLAVRRRQVERTVWYDGAIPSLRIDVGPVATAAFVGAPLHLSQAEQTSWQDPIIDDLAAPPPLAVDDGNRWWRTCLALAEATAADAAGRYVVMLPDLTGAIDALANLRGPEHLLLDLYDQPDHVLAAADQLVGAWERAFVGLYDAVLGGGAGPVQWLGAWSDAPYTLPTCDFNYSISEPQFRQLCMPSLVDQARRAGRCLFHLDGLGASRHARALAESPEITAVQYTPGAGTPSAVAKLEMFRMLQAEAKPVMIACPYREIPALVDALDPRGLVLVPDDIRTPDQAEQALRWIGA